MTLVRSWLYVPAVRLELLPKADAGPADAIVVDLEDAVLASEKAAARRALRDALTAARTRTPVWVRVNGLSTGMTADDVRALEGLPLAGVRLPKTEGADEVRELARLLAGVGHEGLAIEPLIETAVGVERAGEIAAAHPALRSVSIGDVDLAADLGVRDDAGLLYARGRVVVACRAAGLQPPILSVHTALHDLDGLRASTLHGRGLGFLGRAAVHPAQIPIINDVFTPGEDEVARARETVEALERAAQDGTAAVQLAGGRFIDTAMARDARATLDLAARIAAREGSTA